MGANVESAQFDPVVARNRGVYMGKFPVEPVWTQWRVGKNKNIYIDIGYSAVSNSASFIQCCDRSKIMESDRILSPLRREFLDSLSNLRVSVDSVLKGLFPLDFFSNNSDTK